MSARAVDLLRALNEAFARTPRALEVALGDDSCPTDSTSAVLSPYPGLRPFLAEEARFFRGREVQIREIGERLAREQCISVLGGSGTGKSSIVRAGVIPALRRKLIPGRSDLWRAAIFAPGLAPVENLIEALEGTLTPLEEESEKSTGSLSAARRERIREALYRSDGGLGAFLPMYRQEMNIEPTISELARNQANLLIVIDQFEELFRDENRGEIQVANLVGLVVDHWRNRHRYPGLYLALTMRTDDLHRCAEFLDLPDFINATSYLTRRLREHELRDAIISPVRPPLFRAGLLQGEVSRGAADLRPFDTEVVTELLDAVDEIGYDPDHLPLLQHLLAVLWRRVVERWRQEADLGRFELPLRITRDDLAHALEFPSWAALDESRRDRGRLDPGWLLRQCLERVADGLLNRDLFGRGLTESQRAIARTAFCLMGEVDDRGNVKRRWTNREEIARVSSLASPNEDIDAVVRRFSRNHRLVWVRESGVMDVSHEALMRNWPQFARWLAQDREASLAYSKLSRRCRAWCDANRTRPRWLAPWASLVGNTGRLLGSDALDALVPALTERKSRFRRIRPRYNSHWAHRYCGSKALGNGDADAVAAERKHQERFKFLRLSICREAMIKALPLLSMSLLAVILGLTTWQQHAQKTKVSRLLTEREASDLWNHLRPSWDTVLEDDYITGLWAVSSASDEVRSEFVRQLTNGNNHLQEIGRQPQAIVRAIGLKWSKEARDTVSRWLNKELSAPNDGDLWQGAQLACASAAMSEHLSPASRTAAANLAREQISDSEWSGPTPWRKGRILACQGPQFDRETQEAVLRKIFSTWEEKGTELGGLALSAMASAMTSATWQIKAEGGRLSPEQIGLLEQLIGRVVDSAVDSPTQNWAIRPVRSVVSIVAALPLDHQRAALGTIIETSARLPVATADSAGLLIVLAQAFETSARRHRSENRADELRPLVTKAGKLLTATETSGATSPINRAALARLITPLVEVAGADPSMRGALDDLADNQGASNGVQIALWGRNLALSLRESSLGQSQIAKRRDELLRHAGAIAQHGDKETKNLAGEALARAFTAMAEKDPDVEWCSKALEVAKQSLAGTGSAEESAAWATAIVTLLNAFDERRQADTLVEVLKYPTAGLSAREPNARAPENASDILIRALRDTLDPQIKIDWGPGYHLRGLDRLEHTGALRGIDLRRIPEDPRPKGNKSGAG